MKTHTRNVIFSLATAALMAGGIAASEAASVVHVSLWDKGGDMQMATGLEYGMPGIDKSNATMGVRAVPAVARTGKVTFQVRNDSKDTIHEMIVMYLADPSKLLPYIAAENRVDEDKAGDKGEVSELDPGMSGSLTVDLRPGKYLLICNVPGHYAAGMWSEFTVQP